MELVDITKLLYEMTRTKEDRLLMKWEDDRCRLFEEINRLSNANHCAMQTIRRQSDEYNTLIQTISNFGVKSSPKNLSLAVNNKVSANKKTPAIESPDKFITIDRSKTTKKGRLHTFFSTSGNIHIPTKTAKNKSYVRNATSIESAAAEVLSSEDEAEPQALKTAILDKSAMDKTDVSFVCDAANTTPLPVDNSTQPVPPAWTDPVTTASFNSNSSKQPIEVPVLASTSTTAPSDPARVQMPLFSFLPGDAGATCNSFCNGEEEEQQQDLDCTRISEPDVAVNSFREQSTLLLPLQQSLPVNDCESQTTCGSQPATHSAVVDSTAVAPLLWTSSSRCSNSGARAEAGCSPTQSPPRSQDLLFMGAEEGDMEGEDDFTQAFPSTTSSTSQHEIIDLSDSPNKENRSYEKERANRCTSLRTENAETVSKMPNLFSPSMGSDFVLVPQYGDGTDSAAGSRRKTRPAGKRAIIADQIEGVGGLKRRKDEKNGTSTAGSNKGTGKRVSYVHNDEINEKRSINIRSDRENMGNSSASKREGRAADPRKCVESVRSKTLRAALPGFACEECARFYETMQQQGIYNMEDSQMRREVLQSCSRHKARWTPPSTPEGFWSLTLHTPEDWR